MPALAISQVVTPTHVTTMLHPTTALLQQLVSQRDIEPAVVYLVLCNVGWPLVAAAAALLDACTAAALL
jgi:hypothetical protein